MADSSLKHIFLYAKHHYPTELNHVQAIKVLIEDRCGLTYKYVSTQDVYANIFCCFDNIEADWKREFISFITHFYGNHWEVEGYNDDSELTRINRLLSIISLTEVKKIKFDLTKEDKDPRIQKLLDHRYALIQISQWQGLGH